MSSSLDAPTELTQVADSLRNECQRKLNTLRRQLDHQRREDTEAADTRHRDLTARLAAAETRLAALRSAYEDLHRQAGDELRAARRATARLTEEIHLIEGRLHREHGVRPADLDTVPAELAALVARVRAAEQIRAGLLDRRRRDELGEVLTAYTELRRRAAQSRARALDASRALARGKLRSRAFNQAAADYRLHYGQWQMREKAVHDLTPELRSAEAELRRDAERQEAYTAQGGAGAVADLTAQLRHRLDRAVETHALLPAWFTITGLGHRPDPARADRWREVAAQVLLYRITYQVGHGVLALGERPAGGYRAQRYDEIHRALRPWAG
ncbi:hypothetical protein [Actinoplanes sp. N902-109]|uniref:hypothetical protein n=1 Tax=Actinoplanes sp. (strain N902-109) TaxID=649831 RepID=UPI0003293EF7|nr:hypothetical protein [Actinoplanes sp. N902-109]AGL19537.1 hypothetical protein L083_6027 [Actinoplanes sp. N902-109]